MKSRALTILIYLIAPGLLSLVAIEVALRLYAHAPVLTLRDWRGVNVATLQTGGAQYNQMLGWEQVWNATGSGFNTLEYGIRKNSSRKEVLTRSAVLAVGDSYTDGSEVVDDETWPAQLEKLTQMRVLNAGVGGYGLDQIILNAERLLPVVKPRIVIVGIYSEAILHASYNVPKPYFVEDNGNWTLQNQPVPRVFDSAEEPFYRLALSRLLSVHLVFQRFFHDWWFSKAGLHFENKPDRTSCYLLERLQKQLASDGVAGLVVLQYPGWSYVHGRPRGAHVEKVLGCARSLGYEIVDEFDHLSAVARQSIDMLKEHYVISPEGTFGHMSARGNKLIASLISERLPRSTGLARIAPPFK
jgi:hypothetical protein